ncbi:apolipoprotein N-acyltransferase [Candidatus Poribacteria bacterium]|nr:apolipoprotein N-acyltransferase [Candidatus Poribacteria bacterium]
MKIRRICELGVKRYLQAALSGVLLILAFPGINLSSLAWVALVPLLVAVYDANWKQSLISGLISGFVYFVGTLNWFMALGPFSSIFWVVLGLLVLSLYVSCYVIIFAGTINYINRFWINFKRNGMGVFQRITYILFAAAVWTGMEILRGHVATGFPWVALCHTQWRNLPILQLCSVTGMYGITFLIVSINAAFALFVIDIRTWKLSAKAALVPLVFLILSLIYAGFALNQSPTDEKIKIALIPGNIRQKDKIMSWGRADWIFNRYARITNRAAKENPDLIVWPETSVPRYTFSAGFVPLEVKTLVKNWGAYFLIGSPHKVWEGRRKTYNGAFLLSPDGEIMDLYYKMHLVPVSEYFPMKEFLPEKIQRMVVGVSDWDAGSKYTIFSMPPAKFGLSICFESIFPGISRKFASKGTNLAGIITNDAWFEGTYAPEQHLSMAPFRAVENNTSVFRCANNGISCIIDPWGRIGNVLEPNADDEYTFGEAMLHPGGTIYTRLGDYFPWACLAIVVFLVFNIWWYRRKYYSEEFVPFGFSVITI